MKIVYFGSDVYLSSFIYLAEHHEIMALYTYHNDEDYFTEHSIVKEAQKRNIPVHYEDMCENETIRLFEKEGCDLFFSAEYNRLLPIPENCKKFKGINVHASLLPQGRSYYPIEVAMDQKLSMTGVTIHKLVSGLDQGEILSQTKIDITDDIDSIDLYIACAKAVKTMLIQIMDDFESYWMSAYKQDEVKKFPYWKRPETRKMALSHKLTKKEAIRMFRCFNQMMEVKIDNQVYFVRALNIGKSKIDKEYQFLSEDKVLYSLSDGHARLILYRREST